MSIEHSHIVFICSRLDQPGGTERATVNLANVFAYHKHKVTILILDETAFCFYDLDPSIKIIQWNLNFGISEKGNMFSRKFDFFRHVRELRNILTALDADTIIGTEYYLSISSWIAARKLKATFISWEHHHIHWLKKNNFWTFLFKRIYPKFNVVVTQNNTEKKLFKDLGCNAVVIPYVLPEQHLKASLDHKNILTVGWLIKRKGVDLIPSIAEKVFEKHKDWQWKIIGKGEEYDNLRSEIDQKQLDRQLHIIEPVSQDISNEYLQSSIYVMTSRFECLPMVLLEASSFGVPLVAFNCPTGPADIIQHDINGYLLPLEDIDSISASIIALMEDEVLRKKMGDEAKKSSERYSEERIYESWKEVIVRKS